ncbi:Ser/Thr phosphatase family protein [Toxoplasma gondii ME49]|uniref:Ser/Thr phosphatase family protein n=3 Tax=Toxoplasma gondii TaxID=5811 RepID=S8GJY7_TOXGM|nr:Ser/Thr phosphatase family protein [Toxoplasma gondii ME49]EPT32180.1 Ser/Thr phosphatase family protein [Toxoplasma gondii ME49]|eukprot:XP_018638371.1 Ser/Thr phosphatase family protein [Toxoplasma gondii ME49]
MSVVRRHGGCRLPFLRCFLRVFLSLFLLLSVSPVAAFRSLFPPFYSNTTGLSDAMLAAPPTLFLSGRDSAKCACQHTPSSASAAAVSSPAPPDREEAFLFPSLVTGERSGVRGARHDEGATLDAFASHGLCCSDREEAFMRSFEAPNGVAFASIGDTGAANSNQAKCGISLAALSVALDIKFVNLLGDNLYPHGVTSAVDPLWQSAFEVPFGAPSLQKVAFFPVLGNHDYHLDPYAQIDRCIRLGNEHLNFTEKEKTDGSRPQLSKTYQMQAMLPWMKIHHEKFRYSFDQTTKMHGLDGPRWRLPNFWYFTRHVFRNVPRHVKNPFVTGASISDISLVSTEEDKTDVTVVTIYIDSMVLLLEEGSKSSSIRYRFPRDELYYRHLEFLEDTLKAATREADWIFIAGHHPVVNYSVRNAKPSDFAVRLTELMRKYKVDTFLSGHEHALSFFQEPDANTTHIISGTGSKLSARDPIPSKDCLFSVREHGVAVHVLGKEELHHGFVSADGKVLFTASQRRQDRTGILPPPKKEKHKIPLYPAIRRVYIGPYAFVPFEKGRTLWRSPRADSDAPQISSRPAPGAPAVSRGPAAGLRPENNARRQHASGRRGWRRQLWRLVSESRSLGRRHLNCLTEKGEARGSKGDPWETKRIFGC